MGAGLVLLATSVLVLAAHGLERPAAPAAAALRMQAWLDQAGSPESGAVLHIANRSEADPRRRRPAAWLLLRGGAPRLRLFQPVADGASPTVLAPGLALQARAAGGYDQAVDCLAAAIHYEAGVEPRVGQEAVAQVVLNRVRAPGFPKSVCGVVFQGSDLATGCQFTFTCDGSLRRRPAPRAWRMAREIAELALAGRLADTVGQATHYHAFYVRPYWAPTLTRIAQIGAHIFYRRPLAGEPPSRALAALVPISGTGSYAAHARRWAMAPGGRPSRRGGAFSFRVVNLGGPPQDPAKAGQPVVLSSF